MYKRTILLAVLLSFTQLANSQQLIDVTDQTIKIKGNKEEEVMLGFAAGDKIVFNFQEINNKELKEVEILEFPNASKFSDFKTSKIENKQLNVLKQTVYVFRFKNSSLSGRICRIQIQRIPANGSTANFNTTVSWVTKQDTLWNTFTKDVLVGYDTTYIQKTKKELVNTEQREELILEKSQRVHSTTNENSSRTSIFFTLPKNVEEATKTSKVIAWAYWIGVGEEANKAWQSNVKAIQSIIKTGAKYFTSPLGAFAIGAVTDLLTPKLGEDVSYAVTDQLNRDLFLNNLTYRLYDGGKGTGGYNKFTQSTLCQGTYFICMSNDNVIQGINAEVKVIAIVETNFYEDKLYTEQVIQPRYEKKLMKEPVISTANIPVAGL